MLEVRYEAIPLGYEIGATGAPSALKRAARAGNLAASLRHGVASALAVLGYSTLALLEHGLKKDAPRASMTVIASKITGGAEAA